MPSKPVIFLAFANDRVDDARYLRNLPRELDGLRKALNVAEQMGLCEVVERANVTIEQIVSVFQDRRYRDRVAVFHYGGHANGYQLLLESLNDQNEMANSGGLVPFFARQKSLQLVFLNGCSSRPHALELIEAGIPAVVGTAEPINDEVATRLSIRFYRGLAGGLPLARAWAEAEDEVKMSTRKGDYRDFVIDLEAWEAGGHIRELPWELHQRPGAEQVMDWSLPAACGDPLFGLPGLPADIQPPQEPFLFFKRYERKDAAVFFGRSAYIRDLYNRVTDPEAPPLILLYGQSGVGKSSLLDTGLGPRLEHAHEVVYIRRRPEWGLSGTLERALAQGAAKTGADKNVMPDPSGLAASPISPALQQLIGQLDQNLQDLEDTADPQYKPYLEQLKAMQEHGADILKKLQRDQLSETAARHERRRKLQELGETQSILYHWLAAEARLDRPLVIILDQVEEVFTRPGEDKEELDHFLANLQKTFQYPGLLPQGKLMLAYRKEYQPEIEKGCKTCALPRSQVFLERLKRDEIIEVVQGLSLTDRLRSWYHLSVESYLPAMIADDLLSDRDSPVAPILQILVTKLWYKAKAVDPASPEFTVDLYQELKEEGILLDEFFEQQVAQLADALPGPVSSGLLFDLLYYHTTPLGTADSRSLEDIRKFYNHRQDEIDQLVSRCKDLYLLSDAGEKVSLSHDTLAPLVQKAFRESDAPGQRASRILDNKMLDFDPDDPATTLDPADLELVEKGENGMRSWAPRERQLVRLSRMRREKEQRAAKVRWAVFALGMILIAALGIFSFFQKQEADIQRTEALLQRDTAEQQRLLADSSRQFALLQESLAVNNERLAIYRASQADSSSRVAEAERDNALYQKRIAQAEALVNKTDLLLRDNDPAALATAIQAWQIFPSTAAYGAVLHAYHHSPVPRTFTTSQQAITALAGSPDRQWLATGAEEGSIELLDAAGRSVYQQRDHNAKVNGLALSATHLASVSEDKQLVIRSLRDPGLLTRVKLYEANKEVAGEAVAFFPAGRRLMVLTGSSLQTFSTGGEQLDLQLPLSEPPTALQISPDGRTLMLGYSDGRVEARNAGDGSVIFSQKPDTSRVNALTFSTSGSRIARASNNSTVIVMNGAGGDTIPLKGHQRGILAAQFFDQDRYLATGGFDGDILLWDVRSGKSLLTLKAPIDRIIGLSASADGQSLYSVGSDQNLRLWPLQRRHQQVFTQSPGPVNAAVFVGESDRILLGLSDHTTVWWDGRQGYRPTGGLPLKGEITAVASESVGKSAVAVSSRGEALYWKDPDQTPTLLAAVDGLRAFNDVQLSRNWIVGGGRAGAAVWRRDGTLYHIFSHNDQLVQAVAVSPDERSLITISNNAYTAILWSIRDRVARKTFQLPAGTRINDVLFLPGGTELLLAADNGRLYRCNMASGAIMPTQILHSGSVTAMDLSPDGRYLLTADGYTWFLWNVQTEQEIYRNTGHTGLINDVHFSPDGQYILTASADGTARVWLVGAAAIVR